MQLSKEEKMNRARHQSPGIQTEAVQQIVPASIEERSRAAHTIAAKSDSNWLPLYTNQEQFRFANS